MISNVPLYLSDGVWLVLVLPSLPRETEFYHTPIGSSVVAVFVKFLYAMQCSWFGSEMHPPCR